MGVPLGLAVVSVSVVGVFSPVLLMGVSVGVSFGAAGSDSTLQLSCSRCSQHGKGSGVRVLSLAFLFLIIYIYISSLVFAVLFRGSNLKLSVGEKKTIKSGEESSVAWWVEGRERQQLAAPPLSMLEGFAFDKKHNDKKRRRGFE